MFLAINKIRNLGFDNIIHLYIFMSKIINSWLFMNTEIERKYLVKDTNFLINLNPIIIKQGYIFSNKLKNVRVRVFGEKGFITIKTKVSDLKRLEYEYEIPLEDAEKMLDSVCENIIEKDRFEIVYKGKKWEVDQFKGLNNGLIIAEIELEQEDEKIRLPQWIDLEVTADKKYLNQNLALNPYTEW